MKRSLSALAALLLLASISCAGGKRLSTGGLSWTEGVSGAFSVILYGGGHPEEIGTLAILDLEGDDYEIIPFAPEFGYSLLRGLKAEKALAEAEGFLRRQMGFEGVSVRKVMDSAGKTIGYEMRPVYEALLYGAMDLIRVDYYAEEGGRVKVMVTPTEELFKTRHIWIDEYKR